MIYIDSDIYSIISTSSSAFEIYKNNKKEEYNESISILDLYEPSIIESNFINSLEEKNNINNNLNIDIPIISSYNNNPKELRNLYVLKKTNKLNKILNLFSKLYKFKKNKKNINFYENLI